MHQVPKLLNSLGRRVYITIVNLILTRNNLIKLYSLGPDQKKKTFWKIFNQLTDMLKNDYFKNVCYLIY